MTTQTATREHPIVFNGDMIRAILREENPKTQTRRLVKPQPEYQPALLEHADRHRWSDGFNFIRACPYGQPGDHLWCKETFALRQDVDPVMDQAKAIHYLKYRADADDLDMTWHYYDHWRSSILMPRWASRITLEITGVRVERLRAITEEDAIAEGIDIAWLGNVGWLGTDAPSGADYTYVEAFRRLWDSINAKRGFSWESDPFCWVISFRRIKP